MADTMQKDSKEWTQVLTAAADAYKKITKTIEPASPANMPACIRGGACKS